MLSEVFCLTCFSTMPADAQTCPACGQGVAAASARDYREKLTRALRHPLADVRMRAIIALGLRGEASVAFDLVVGALRHPTDVIEGLEVVKSLHKIEDLKALETLRDRHPSVMVRRAASAAVTDYPSGAAAVTSAAGRAQPVRHESK